MNPASRLQLGKDTLIVLPCSSAKRPGSGLGNGQAIDAALDPARSAALKAARGALRQKASMDEQSLMPAYLRYSGELYQHGSESIAANLAAGFPVLIVSGGYGLVLA